MSAFCASLRYRFKVWGTRTNILYAGLLFFAIILVLRLGAETLIISSSNGTSTGGGGGERGVVVSSETFSSEIVRERFDESKLSAGTNYPVCQRLNGLYQELMDEENARSVTEEKYTGLYEAGNLHCGQVREYGPFWILGRKHKIRRSVEKCIPELLDSKRRMLGWLSDQCAVQDKHNHYWRLQQDHVAKQLQSNSPSAKSKASLSEKLKENNKEKSLMHITSPYRHSLRKLSDITVNPVAESQLTPVNVKRTKPQERQRGIVYTGLYSHFKDIYQSILAHRNLRVSLPVEVWVDAADYDICTTVFETVGAYEFLNSNEEPMSSEEAAKLGTTHCRSLPLKSSGFASKFYALLGTHFTDVLFMDADNIAVRDVNAIFNSTAYKTTGAVMWPDLWGEACRETTHRSENGWTGFQTSVLWQAHIGGLNWHNTRNHAHEVEAGQIAFDLTRHAGLLDIGRRFIEDESFFKHSVYGDKDVFRLIHQMVDEPFTFVDAIPGYSTPHPGAGRDCLTHYFGNGGEAGANNVIAADTSGAFEFGGSRSPADKPKENVTDDLAKPKGEKSFMFSFGSFVGSLFGNGIPKKTTEECEKVHGGNCGGISRERNGMVRHLGKVVTMDSLSKADQALHRFDNDAATASATGIAITSSVTATPPKHLNALGKPAGEGWGAPIGTDPMFFHQLKNRDASAFRFAYRLSQDTKDVPSVCFDFQAVKPEGDNSIVTYKHPSADRLFVFATKLFLQVDWKWGGGDSHNSWSWLLFWHSLRRNIASNFATVSHLLVLPVLLIGVTLLIYVLKMVSTNAYSASDPKST